MFAKLEQLFARRERMLVIALLLAGFIARIGWLFLNPAERLGPHKSEMWHVAAHFAANGALADAYGPGSGVSSHVGPFNTMLVGFVYRLLGIGSPAAELTLAVIAAAVVCTLFYFLYRLAADLGIPVVARVGALAFLCLMPRNFYVEVVDFRVREGAFAAMIAAGMLWWMLSIERRRGLGLREFALFSLAAGFAFLINPGMALGVLGGLGVIGLRHIPIRRWPACAALLIAGFVAVNGAWVVRNYGVYDRFMPSRGNFGLEFAIANHPAAVDPADPRQVFNARMKEVHPFFSPEAFARLKSHPNDAAYFSSLGQEASAWIKAHPGDFARLTLRHLRELYFPSAWQFDLYGTGATNVLPKQAIFWAISGFGLAGLLLGLFTRPWPYLYVAITLAFPTLLYIIVQPTPRYTYLFVGLLTFLAAAAGWALLTGWRGLGAARPSRQPG